MHLKYYLPVLPDHGLQYGPMPIYFSFQVEHECILSGIKSEENSEYIDSHEIFEKEDLKEYRYVR